MAVALNRYLLFLALFALISFGGIVFLSGTANSEDAETIQQLKKQVQFLRRSLEETKQELNLYQDESRNPMTSTVKRLEAELRSNTKNKQTPKQIAFQKELDNYAKMHNEITSGKLPPRYVNCVLINGWGNVLQEAVSCFLFGLVSKRAVIFNIQPLHYMPFAEWIREQDMPFKGYYFAPLSQYKEKIIPRFELPCLDVNTVANEELITVHLTYDYYATNMIVNPYHGEQLLEILPENYFQMIFNFCFKLAPELQREVDDYKKKYFGAFNVGIQIRAPTTSKQTGEKDHKGFPVPPPDLYAQAAEQLSRFQERADYEDVSWFIATQNTQIIDRLRAAYGAKKILSYNGTITTTFEKNAEGQRVSLLTWWILGECDEVVTTEASSYGTVAAARRGVTPIVCNHDKFCMRRLSPTPCQDTHFLADQPQECLQKLRKFPHQFLTAPDSSCGYYKLAIYKSEAYQKDAW